MGSIDPMHKALPMAGRAPNKPLGLALGTSNPRGRQVSSGKHAGICNASAAGTPFTKRWKKGSRGIKGEYRTSRTKLTMSDWSSLMWGLSEGWLPSAQDAKSNTTDTEHSFKINNDDVPYAHSVLTLVNKPAVYAAKAVWKTMGWYHQIKNKANLFSAGDTSSVFKSYVELYYDWNKYFVFLSLGSWFSVCNFILANL